MYSFLFYSYHRSITINPDLPHDMLRGSDNIRLALSAVYGGVVRVSGRAIYKHFERFLLDLSSVHRLRRPRRTPPHQETWLPCDGPQRTSWRWRSLPKSKDRLVCHSWRTIFATGCGIQKLCHDLKNTHCHIHNNGPSELISHILYVILSKHAGSWSVPRLELIALPEPPEQKLKNHTLVHYGILTTQVIYVGTTKFRWFMTERQIMSEIFFPYACPLAVGFTGNELQTLWYSRNRFNGRDDKGRDCMDMKLFRLQNFHTWFCWEHRRHLGELWDNSRRIACGSFDDVPHYIEQAVARVSVKLLDP